ncbi:PASTA domain-containing protein [Schwartzia sp. (in: firmicutes)]
MHKLDVTGRPLDEAESLLKAAGLSYVVDITRSTHHKFSVDETRLYVVRQKAVPENGLIHILAAAKQRKEVSEDGIQNQ